MGRHTTNGPESVAALALPLLLAASVVAVEFKPVAGAAGLRLGWRDVEVGDVPAAQLAWMPRRASANARFLAIHLGNATNAVIHGLLDESKGTDTGFDTLYVDADNDGNLTDDRPIHPKREQIGRLTLLDVEPMEVTVRYADGARRNLRLKIELRGYRKGGSGVVLWKAGCHLDQHMEGAVAVGVRQVRVAVYDASRDKTESNGCFNDYGADRLRLDLDGDGNLDALKEDMPLSRAVLLDGKLWDFEVDAAARNVSVKPSSLPAGHIAIIPNFTGGAEPPSGAIEFVSDRGYAFRHDLAASAELTAPEAVYRAERARVFMRDISGRLWEASFTLAQGVKVERNARAEVVVGAPFVVEPVVEGDMSPGIGFCITARLTGVGGEDYRNIAPAKTRMKPLLAITDSDGICVLNTRMEYG